MALAGFFMAAVPEKWKSPCGRWNPARFRKYGNCPDGLGEGGDRIYKNKKSGVSSKGGAKTGRWMCDRWSFRTAGRWWRRWDDGTVVGRWSTGRKRNPYICPWPGWYGDDDRGKGCLWYGIFACCTGRRVEAGTWECVGIYSYSLQGRNKKTGADPERRSRNIWQSADLREQSNRKISCGTEGRRNEEWDRGRCGKEWKNKKSLPFLETSYTYSGWSQGKTVGQQCTGCGKWYVMAAQKSVQKCDRECWTGTAGQPDRWRGWRTGGRNLSALLGNL